MSEESAIQFFIARAAAHVRELPLHEAAKFLKGGLLLIGDRPEVEPLRLVSMHLVAADNQLEQIASAQLQLPLEKGGAQ